MTDIKHEGMNYTGEWFEGNSIGVGTAISKEGKVCKTIKYQDEGICKYSKEIRKVL